MQFEGYETSKWNKELTVDVVTATKGDQEQTQWKRCSLSKSNCWLSLFVFGQTP